MSIAALRPIPSAPETATTSRPELLVDRSEGSFRKLVHDLFAFMSRHQAIRDGHGAVIGLAGTQYTVLIAVAYLQNLGEVNITTVSQHLHVSSAFVTRLVNQLIEQDLLSKTRALGDRRRVIVRLTAGGAALLARLRPVQQQVNDVEFRSLSAVDFANLIRITARLIHDSDQALALQHYLGKAPQHRAMPLRPLTDADGTFGSRRPRRTTEG